MTDNNTNSVQLWGLLTDVSHSLKVKQVEVLWFKSGNTMYFAKQVGALY